MVIFSQLNPHSPSTVSFFYFPLPAYLYLFFTKLLINIRFQFYDIPHRGLHHKVSFAVNAYAVHTLVFQHDSRRIGTGIHYEIVFQCIPASIDFQRHTGIKAVIAC